MSKIYKTLYLLFLLVSYLYSQSGSQFRRTAVINGNEIQTVISNWGVIAQPAPVGPQGSWKGTDNSYISDMSILLGIELPVKDYNNNGIPDTVHSVIISEVDRILGFESCFGHFCGFEPDSGFFNFNHIDSLTGIALSNVPDSWPETWPDHPEYGPGVWNGLFGANSFTGDQEAYFRIDDANDDELYNDIHFLPDSTNQSKKGFGINISIRYIQFDNPLFNDILFKIYDIKNESIYNYSKVVFGGLTGTNIAGPDDDATLFYPEDNFIMTYDFDNHVDRQTNPGWAGPVGMFGEKLLLAPDNNSFASFDYFVPLSNLAMGDDDVLWQKMRPGIFSYPPSIVFENSIPYAIKGENGDYLYGTGYFSLDSGETKRIAASLAFGYSKDEILLKTKLAEALFNSGFDTAAVHNAVEITSPSYHQEISGTYNIKWNSINTVGTVEILYSGDAGSTWNYITKSAPNNGLYLFNTADVEDAVFSKLIIFVKDEEGKIFGYDESGYFTIDNIGNGKPSIKILNEDLYSGTISGEEHDFNLLIGDPENQPMRLDIYYSFGDSNFHYTQSLNAVTDTLPQTFPVNLKIIPNSNELVITIDASDDNTSFSDKTKPFIKETLRDILPQNNYQIISLHTEALVEIRIVDSALFLSNEYYITFNDTLYENYKTFSVFNTDADSFTLLNQSFYPYSETQFFDGMSLYTEDIRTEFDADRSRWNHPHPQNFPYSLSLYTSPELKGRPDPFDYILAFSDGYNDSSNYLFKILGADAPPAKTKINFKVFRDDGASLERIQFAFVESGSWKEDTLSVMDQVIFSNENGTAVSWLLQFEGCSSSIIPGEGDTLYIFTKKGLSIYDTLRIYNLPLTFEDDKYFPLTYSLYQNYPNPFNPVTIINYSLPVPGNVVIKIFDILGREVRTLADGFKSSGIHKIVFNASSLASGVYLYQMRVNGFTDTKKLMLVK
ncbi:MAG: T9SS type A sorting domain-containing protein [Ignavibacteria bacterium]